MGEITNTTYLEQTGRSFFGLAIAGIGAIHFFIPGFQPDILPVAADHTYSVYPYLTGSFLTVAGIMIIADRQTHVISWLLGCLLLLFLLLGHLPIRLTHHPDLLMYWTSSIKLMALMGGAFVLSHGTYSESVQPLPGWANKISAYGKYPFALQLILFGTTHILSANDLSNIVPEWIPFRPFMVYVTGFALVGSGLSIILNFKVKIILFLAAIMFFSWLILLHIPSLIFMPPGNGSMVSSTMDCLAACSTCLLLSTAQNHAHV